MVNIERKIMKPKQLPLICTIKQQLEVDELGRLYRNGELVKNKTHRDGYLYITLNGQIYTQHRISYALQTGEVPTPDKFIDHINGDKTDNRLDNLRLVSHQINMKNQKLRNTNKSGHVGILFDKEVNKWRARITIDYKNVHLGYFDDKNDAIKARERAEKENKFHTNHGR